MKRDTAAKGQVDGLTHARLVVTGYRFGSQPLVELRTMVANRQPVMIDLSLRQAREAVRLIETAIQALEADTRRDETIPASDDRASSGEDDHEHRSQGK